MSSYKEYRDNALRNPETKNAYDNLKNEYDHIQNLLDANMSQNLSQDNKFILCNTTRQE